MIRIEEESIVLEREMGEKTVSIELSEEEIEEIMQAVRLEEADRMFIEYANNLSEEEQERIRKRIASPEQYDDIIYFAAEKQKELLQKTAALVFEAAFARTAMY